MWSMGGCPGLVLGGDDKPQGEASDDRFFGGQATDRMRRCGTFRYSHLVWCLLMATVYVSSVRASPMVDGNHSEAQALPAAMAELLERHDMRVDGPTFDRPACRTLLDNLKRNVGVEYLRPSLMTDDPEHPAIVALKQRCPGMRIAKDLAILRGPFPDDVSYAEQEEWATWIHVGTRGFALYRADIDGDTTNGEEVILYYDGRVDIRHDNQPSRAGAYQILDDDACTALGGGQFGEIFTNPVLAAHGVIGISERPAEFGPAFAYETSAEDGYARLKFYGFNREKSKWGSYCSFEAVPPRNHLKGE